MKDRDLNSMEYRDIEYAVLARPGRNRWTWTIYPDGKTVKELVQEMRAEFKGYDATKIEM
jgi:hypothetical protein